ncbi:MAG TPA: MFS transporter [Clostridia bacterium]|nr:MFS transporter [Clostridia bacterium]
MKTRKFHYAWVILIACCMLQVAGIGILSNTSASFITAVCSDRDLSFVNDAYEKSYTVKYDELVADGTGAASAQILAEEYAEKHYITDATPNFAMYMLLQGIVAGLTFFFVNKILKKFDIRVILFTGTIVIVSIFALMSRFTQLWQWYAAGAVLGMATAVVWFLPAPIMIGNWFRKHLGIAMGITTASAYIAGMALNPVIAKVFVNNWDWRGAYIAVAAISLIISLSVIFLCRTKPEDMGMTALGADDKEVLKSLAAKHNPEAANAGMDAKLAFRTSAFLMVVIAASLVAYNATHMNVAGNFGAVIGLGANASYIVSAILLGGIVFRLIYGLLNDKIGLKKTISIGVFVAITGFLGLIFANINVDAKIVAFIGAFLIGSMAAISGTLIPILIRQTFGGKNFSAIYGVVMAVVSLFGSSAVFIVPTIAKLSSYTVTFSLAIFFCLVILACSLGALKKGEKLIADRRLAEEQTNE